MKYALMGSMAVMMWAPGVYAQATSELKDTGVQVFRKDGCAAESEAFFDECTCEVQVKYHQIAGRDAINALLAPDADLRSYCSSVFQVSSDEPQQPSVWKKIDKKDSDNGVYEFRSLQEITLLTPRWLALLTQDYVYSGGAHGNTGLSSILYDLESQKEVPYRDVIDLEQVPAANASIQEQLNARKHEIFDEFVDLKNPAYIAADGSCASCVYVLRQEGLHAMFQQYAVAPYSSGVIDITLPAAFLKTPWHSLQKGN